MDNSLRSRVYSLYFIYNFYYFKDPSKFSLNSEQCDGGCDI